MHLWLLTFAALQIPLNPSIHILAKSDENIPANSQTCVSNDWVDLKGKSGQGSSTASTDKKSPVQSDKVQHEVAALRMAQGLLKGNHARDLLCCTAGNMAFLCLA